MRGKRAEKHGGGLVRHDVADVPLPAEEPREDLIALDEALTKLEQTDATAANLVALRCFAGFTIEEAAQLLDMSPRSADRLWSYARACVHGERAS